MSHKAISTFIATVILVAFTVSAAAIVTSFLTGIVKFQTTSVSSQAVCAQKGALFIDTAMCVRVRDNSLVGYWRLESMNTTNYTSDLSGYSNDGKYFGEDFNTGTLTNMNTVGNSTSGWTANGVNGTKALQFDGVNDYVDAGNFNGVKGKTEMTIVFWVYKLKNVIHAGPVSGTGNAAASQRIYLMLDSSNGGGDANSFYIVLSNGTDQDSLTSNHRLPLNQWEHVAIAFKGGDSIKIYSNGVLNASKATALTSLNSNPVDNLLFGKYAENYFNGTIDEVRIYNRSLSAGEIEAIYKNNTYIRNGLAGYWRFNEGSGSSAYDTHHIATLDNAAGATQIGNALSFDGVNDYVDAGNFNGVKGKSEMTIVFWVYKLKNVIHAGPVSGTGNAAASQRIYLMLDSSNGGGDANSFYIGLSNGTDQDSLNSNYRLPLNQWEHVAIAFRGGDSIKIYSNGVLNANKSTTLTSLNSNPVDNLLFGKYAGEYFNGTIDEVRIYNRSLSADEISQLYQKGLEKFAADGYFKTIKTSVRNIGSTPLSNFTVFADVNGRFYQNDTPLNGGLTLPGGSEPLTLQAYTYYDGPIKMLKVSVLNCPISMSLTNDSSAIGTC